MDPFTLATGVAGILSLTTELTKIFTEYVGGVASAPKSARSLFEEITALSHVLSQLVDFLRSENAKGNTFDKTSALCSMIAICQSNIEGLYKKIGNLSRNGGSAFERLKWPLSEKDCQKSVERLHRCAQFFHFSLSVSSWFAPKTEHPHS
jgi:hypothetical protein